MLFASSRYDFPLQRYCLKGTEFSVIFYRPLSLSLSSARSNFTPAPRHRSITTSLTVYRSMTDSMCIFFFTITSTKRTHFLEKMWVRQLQAVIHSSIALDKSIILYFLVPYLRNQSRYRPKSKWVIQITLINT